MNNSKKNSTIESSGCESPNRRIWLDTLSSPSLCSAVVVSFKTKKTRRFLHAKRERIEITIYLFFDSKSFFENSSRKSKFC